MGMKILIKAKDARADISNEVSDALARVNELRGQVRGEGPDESQVLSIRNKLEKSEQHLHRTEEAADTVSVQKTKAQRQVQADGSQVSTARAAVKTAVEDAEDDGKQNTAKLAKKLEKQDQKHEETKLEEKAVMKVEELAIEHKKGQALREEEKEKTIFTDADMKAKSEAAFLRTERKVDQIFDNIKPLVLNLAKSPAAMEQEGSATGVKSIVESEGTQASGEGETRLLMDNMLKSKEMMHAAEVRIHKLQRVVDDGSLNAHAPKKLRIQARIKRLTTEYKEEQGMTRSVKRERRKVNKRTRKLQTDADQKVAKAEDQMATITERAVNLAKVNGERAVAAAQAALADVQRVLEEGKKAQEATASVVSAKVKMCKELVQPTMTSKDEAALCSVVKEEQHCSFFDYARYCAKSCGTCVL